MNDFSSSLYIPYNCLFLVAWRSRAIIKISEVFHITPSLPPIIQTVGYWDGAIHLTDDITCLYNRRKNLQGITLKVAVIDNPPVTKLKTINGSLVVDGYFHNTWKELQEQLHFRTEYRTPRDNTFGHRLNNNSWNGMIGMVLTEETDLALGAMMYYDRANVITFSAPILTLHYHLLIKQPKYQYIGWRTYLAPFHANLWTVIIATHIEIFLSLLFIKIIYGKYHNLKCTTNTYNHHSQQKTLLSRGALITNKSSSPQSLSYEIVTLSRSFTNLVISAAFSAALVSALATHTLNVPYNSLEELAGSKQYQFGFVNGSALFNLFQTSGKYLKEMYKDLVISDLNNIPPSYTKGIERVCDETNYGFLMPYEVAGIYIKNAKCTIIPLKNGFHKGGMANAFSRNNSYVGLINHMLLKMQECGIQSMLHHREWLSDIRVAIKENEQVQLYTVLPLFVILFTGCIIALLILVLELSEKRMRH